MPEFTNACEAVVWYKVTNPNYEDFVKAAKVTITPREVTLISESKLDFVYDGQPHTHSLIIISEAGFVGDEGIVASNWATVTTVAEGAVDNTFDYVWKDGTRAENYDLTLVWGKIAVVGGDEPTHEVAELEAAVAWKLNLGTGCYTAQLRLTCTGGLSAGVADLKFLMADQMSGSTCQAGLWNSAMRDYRPPMTVGSTTYRYVDLPTAAITAENTAVTYGVADVSSAMGVVAKDECAIECYSRTLVSPAGFPAYIAWTSGGDVHVAPVAQLGSSSLDAPLQAAADAARNVFARKASAADKVIAAEAMAMWKGAVLTMAYPDSAADGAIVGWNTFGLRIGARGKVRVSGRTAAGKTVSASAQMLVGDDWYQIPVRVSKRGITLDFTVWMAREGDGLAVTGVADAVIGRAAKSWALAKATPDRLEMGAFGDDGRIGAPESVRLSYSRSSGNFTGTAKVGVVVGTRVRTKSVKLRGVVIDGVGYGMGTLAGYGSVSVLVR